MSIKNNSKDLEMKSNLAVYFKKPSEEKILVSAWLDSDLVHKVNAARKKNKLKTSALLRGLLEFYLDNQSMLKK